jgi:hypothetical protein
MTTRELERLLDLLAKWSETHTDEHELRDYVAELRNHMHDEVDG